MKNSPLVALVAPILLLTMLSACVAGSGTSDRRTPEQATLDESSHTIDPPMLAGQAEAFFILDTGRDQMSENPALSQLILIVRYGDTEKRHIIAQCRESALGTALGGGTWDLLEVAECDGEYWLETGGGIIKVSRIIDNPQTEVFRLSLPKGIEAAVRPAAKTTQGE